MMLYGRPGIKLNLKACLLMLIASQHKRFKATLFRTQTSCYSNVWAKPVRPQIKVNVDAACNFGRAAIAAIARDWRGEVVFACSK